MTMPRILVVEDEGVVARDIQSQLQALGYDPVGHAMHGEDALAMTIALRPDLVLMDIQLAGPMDGITAATAIRDKTQIPVVFLTAFTTEVALDRAKRAQPYGFVIKPFSQRELHSALEMALYKCQAEAELREAAQHTHTVLNKMVEGVITIDSTGTIEMANQAACAIFGYRLSEMVGHNLSKLMPEPDQSRHDGYLRHYEETGEARMIGMARDVIALRKGGIEFPINLSVSRVQRAGRNIFIGCVRDLTEQRHFMEEIRRHRDRLEELIAERTAELTLARQQADAANQAKSMFVAHLSHEIRTPMNAILGFTQILKSDALTPRQLEGVGKIERAGQHMMSVINDVLDFTKVDANRLVLEEVDFHLPTLLADVLSFVSESALAKGLHLTLHASEVLPWLRGDPTRLRQALLNYVANAVKFTEQGSITVRVSCRCDGASAQMPGAEVMLRMEVTDTGIGIASDKIEQLFKPFEQANASTTRQYGGTGLGLAITARLARLMGGDAGLHSEPGVGSTFWFTACMHIGQDVALAAPTPSVDSVEALRRLHSGCRVLVVDDDMFNREVASELLHTVGLRVDIACDGFEAVSQAQMQLYDLVLMDVQMPLMNGLDATRRMRLLAGWAATPILALTANAFESDREACLEAGMNDLLVKPIRPALLYAAALRWLTPPTAQFDQAGNNDYAT
jgi:two-component system, sensor histidine kinase and response regulator